MTTALEPLARLYEAVPLDPAQRCIRVIDVHGCSTPQTMEESLSATFRNLDLRSDPVPLFNTLSYVWGAPADDQCPCITLHFEGLKADLRLTRNCHQALVYLRARLGNFTVWVDAICIDQSKPEKMHQINQMGDIYAASAKTYIWLTPKTGVNGNDLGRAICAGHTSSFFDLSQGLHEAILQPRPWRAAIRFVCTAISRPFAILPGRLGSSLGCIFRLDHLAGSDLLRILADSWVERLWTYQELMLARNPVVVYETTHVAWPLLALRTFYVWKNYMYDWRNIQTREDVLRPWYILINDRSLLSTSSAQNATPSSHLRFGTQMYWEFEEAVTYRTIICTIFVLPIPITLLLIPYILSPHVLWRILLVPVFVFSVMTMFALMYPFARGYFARDRGGSAFYGALGLLRALQVRRCSSIQDHNYAVRAVIERQLDLPLEPLDHSCSWQESHTDLTYNLLKVFPYGHILHCAGSSVRMEGQPSWSMDWSQHRPLHQIRFPGCQSLLKDSNSFSDAPWRVSRRLKDQINPEKAGSTTVVFDEETLSIHFNRSMPGALKVRAQMVGTVVSVHELRTVGPTYTDADHSGHQHNLAMLVDLIGVGGPSKGGIRAKKLFWAPYANYGTNEAAELAKALEHIARYPGISIDDTLERMRHMSRQSEDLQGPQAHLAQLIKFIHFLAMRKIHFVRVCSECLCGDCQDKVCFFRQKTCTHERSRIVNNDKVFKILGMPEMAITRMVEPNKHDSAFMMVNTCDAWSFVGSFQTCPRLKVLDLPYMELQ